MLSTNNDIVEVLERYGKQHCDKRHGEVSHILGQLMLDAAKEITALREKLNG